MQTTLILLPVVTALTTGCLGATNGSGRAGSEDRVIAAFDAINASGAYQLDVRHGSEPTVRVTGDDNLVPLVRTEVQGNTLRIRTEGNLHPDRPLVVYVTTPKLEALRISGAIEATVAGVKTDAFAVTLSGASKLIVDGATRTLELSASGASHADTTQLRTREANIRGSGAVHLKVHASDRIEGRISGACNLEYVGAPTEVRVETSGASSVKGQKRETAWFNLPRPQFTVAL